MADPDAAFGRGDVMRRLEDLEARLARMETTRRLESASIGAGGLTVKGGFIVILDSGGEEIMRLSTDGLSLEGLLAVAGAIAVSTGGSITVGDGGDVVVQSGGDVVVGDGGNVVVEDGGDVEVRDGGAIVGRYADGSSAVRFGSLVDADTGDASGHGLHVQDDQAGSGHDIFRAKRDENGDRQVFIGSQTNGTPNRVDEMIVRSELILLDSGDSINLEAVNDVTLAAEDGVFLGGDAGVVNEPDNGEVFIIDMVTGGGSANVAITGAGLLFEVTSMRAAKVDIADFHVDPQTALRLRPRTWRDRREAEADSDTDRWHVGFVAEEVDEVGLGAFVDYGADGRPRSIAYDRLSVALLSVVQWQEERIAALERGQVAQPQRPEPTTLPKRRATATPGPPRRTAR